jgi:DedD protein
MQGHQPEQERDTEITLGTGKLLAIFFAAVTICGVFFGLGYSAGRKATPLDPMNANNLSGVTGTTGGSKPGAGTVAKPLPVDCATSANGCVPPATSNAANSANSSSASSGTTDPGTQNSSSTAAAQTIAVDNGTARSDSAGQSNIMVQVAAVTKQEDADALVNALRRKNYPVFALSNSGTDKLFHVQVGPFADIKDAEAMKAKLVGDGYNAIVKK